MLINNRVYHFIGQLTLNKSRTLHDVDQPNDDKVNWLFLSIDEMQFSFIYKIKNPSDAQFEKPFEAELSFIMIDRVKKKVKLNHLYEVLRGQEVIGKLSLIKMLD